MPVTAMTYYTNAENAFNDKQYDEAIKLANQALEHKKPCFLGYLTLAKISLREYCNLENSEGEELSPITACCQKLEAFLKNKVVINKVTIKVLTDIIQYINDYIGEKKKGKQLDLQNDYQLMDCLLCFYEVAYYKTSSKKQKQEYSNLWLEKLLSLVVADKATGYLKKATEKIRRNSFSIIITDDVVAKLFEKINDKKIASCSKLLELYFIVTCFEEILKRKKIKSNLKFFNTIIYTIDGAKKLLKDTAQELFTKAENNELGRHSLALTLDIAILRNIVMAEYPRINSECPEVRLKLACYYLLWPNKRNAIELYITTLENFEASRTKNFSEYHEKFSECLSVGEKAIVNSLLVKE